VEGDEMPLNTLRFSHLSKDKSQNSGFRLTRFNEYIKPLINDIIKDKGSCSIIDLGGAKAYWDGFFDKEDIKITLVNLDPHQARNDPRFIFLNGDARNLHQFSDNSFDLVHSNSVIEHVGRWTDMRAMSNEVRRLAPAYYIQTPNFWFPFDPHTRMPFIHWLPTNLRYHLHSQFNLGFYEKASDIDRAMCSAEDAVMLDAKQMEQLFPDAIQIREKVAGLTKSFISIRAWSHAL
jgi:hypothetical protein